METSEAKISESNQIDLNGDEKIDSDEVVSMIHGNAGADDDDGDEPAPSAPQAVPPAAAIMADPAAQQAAEPAAPVPSAAGIFSRIGRTLPSAPSFGTAALANFLGVEQPLVVDHEAGLLRGSVRKGRVRVSLIRAANLRAGDSDGLSDPYMKLKLGGMTEVSAVVKKTLNPRFDWDCTFGFEDRTFAFDATLKIEAWDHDFGVSLDDKLGHGTLQLAEFATLLIEGVRVERTVALQYKPLIGKAVAAGEVFVAVSWEPGSLLTATADMLPKHKKTKTRKPPRLDEKGTAGIVKVFLSHATDLRAADKNGFSDPYIKVALADMVERSSVQYKTLNPAWFEVFTFRFDHLDDACRERLYLKAYDHDIDSLNDHLGTASVHLGDHKDAFGRGEALYSHLQLDEDPASLRAPSTDAHILRVHLQRARGLRAADKGGTSDPYVKFRLSDASFAGERLDRSQVVRKSLDPEFDENFVFRIDAGWGQLETPIGFCSSLTVEAWDYDDGLLYDGSELLGRGTLALVPLKRRLLAGERVECTVPLTHEPRFGNAHAAGGVVLTVSWEAVKPKKPAFVHVTLSWVPDLPIFRPAMDEGDKTPLVSGPPPPPKPRYDFLLYLGVCFPVGMMVLAWGAQYSAGAIFASFVFPFICILAYLVTPCAPADDDPTEPPLPTMEAYLPKPIMAMYNCIIGLIFSLIDRLTTCVLYCVGDALAPHMLIIAQALQVSMGVFAAAEAGLDLKDVSTIAQALIIFIMTIIAVPDSFSWALEPGTKVGDAWISMQNSINERQQRVEKTAAVSTEIVLTSVQERVEFMKESMAGSCGGGDEKKSPLRPFVRLAMVYLDGVGEVVRASPFLVVVLVLDAGKAVDDMTHLPDPIEVYIAILSSLAVAAAGSEFVRKYVKPQEYAMQKAKEAEAKSAQLEKNRADQALRAILATPVEEVEIEAAKLAIDEAHEANVMNSLIEKTFEHLQLAVKVQLMDPHS